ncbi:guanitoxin biosynthesis heme-dependent pre-guanitoxin N-hydroxylase GntA [Christiangramia crocea]|uniref:YqcI/YcgG family protein n=1 Tax=Christiangramia crocea TaxID=2904124 RepID=A0A9X1UW16_9FLAO|nr:guanitoxin biosynthesis heme-dependent pre-guanitoxin N-hydroxylase GntA [Gramella crocea]MCG9970504.1 YqcI/YcgG family protein [Gramella crocea]
MRLVEDRPELKKVKEYSDEKMLKRQFEDFILENDHPCVMAQTVFSMEQVELHAYKDFGSAGAARKLIKDLEEYVAGYDFESNDFRTFLAVFPDSPNYSEIEFEKRLWKQLKALNEADKCDWDARVSSDPESEHFSFSIAGRAFYIVGMHPGASRKARQSPCTAIAFNLHWQFEKLREMGTYETVRDKIRERDKELQGNINPMLEDFGKRSEARQYSGREVGDDWKCPFHHSK